MATMKELMSIAYQHNFAIPAVNIENFDMLEGVIKGAQIANSPIIIQTTEPTVKCIDPAYLVTVVEFLRKKYNSIVMLHLDHASNVSLIKKCVYDGFDSVMLDYSNLPLYENIKKCKEVMSEIKDKDVAIELEIGAVGDKQMKSVKTSICEAQTMLDQTSCDMLAISIGNSHGELSKQKILDMDLLQSLNNILHCPLVLHGSSGVLNDYIANSTQYGICKVNIETEYRQDFKRVLSEYLMNSVIVKPRELREEIISAAAKKTAEKCRIMKSENTLHLFEAFKEYKS